MKQTINSATLYRNMIREMSVNYHPSSEVDNHHQEFFEYLQDSYLQAKERQEKSAIFVFAAGLLTYGQLEVVDDILDNIPSGKGHVRRLAWTVTTLLPIPKDLDVFEDVEGIRKWLADNKDQLHWNVEQECFYSD